MDWSEAAPETVKEIVRGAEMRMQAQLHLATSADQRSSVMASIFTAAAAVILGGLVTLISGDHQVFPVLLGGAVAAVMFIAAAGLCIWATLPIGFWAPGTEPEDWEEDVRIKKALEDSLRDIVKHAQEKIAENRATLSANARRFKAGAILGALAPLVGFGVWGLIYLGQISSH